MRTRNRHQSGHVFRRGDSWFVRYRELTLQQDGRVRRIQRCRKLADVAGEYRSKRAAQVLADEILRPLNDRTATLESTMSITDFVENHYWSFVEEQRRLSTFRGYKNVWKRYLADRCQRALRDFRTMDGERMLLEIARAEDLSRSTLMNIKNLLSGIFTYARRIGVLATPNPMRDVLVPKGRAKAETYAYSLEEIMQILTVLPTRVVPLVAAAAFTGVRKGELCGFRWEDYDGEQIVVTQSIWRGHAGDPKTRASAAAIPIVSPLKNYLEQHRLAKGRPTEGLMFPNTLGKPLNIDELTWRVIRPALKKAGIEWHGWHAFRRGLATNLYRLGVQDKVIQAILRHSSLATTMNAYVKTAKPETLAAMKAFEDYWDSYCSLRVQQKANRPTTVLQ